MENLNRKAITELMSISFGDHKITKSVTLRSLEYAMIIEGELNATTYINKMLTNMSCTPLAILDDGDNVTYTFRYNFESAFNKEIAASISNICNSYIAQCEVTLFFDSIK